MTLALQLLANALPRFALLAVTSIAFGLIFRTTGVFHVAFGALSVASACLLYLLVTAGANPWLAGLVALAASAAAGWAVETCFHRPLRRRGLKPEGMMVASFGLAIVIESLAALFVGNETLLIGRIARQSGLLGLTWIQFGEVVAGLVVVSSLPLVARFKGVRVLRAVADDASLLAVHGWQVRGYQAAAMALGTVLAALAACLSLYDIGIHAHAGMNFLLPALTAVLAGGRDRPISWVIAAACFVLLETLTTALFAAKWADLAAYAALLAVLFVRRRAFLEHFRRVEEP